MSNSQALITTSAFLVILGFAACAPKPSANGEAQKQAELSQYFPTMPRILENFVKIPPSGEAWKEECIRRGIEHRPVDGFYLQTRPVSLSQYRDLGGDVGSYGAVKDLNWDSAWNFDNWMQAVNWTGSLSAEDPQFEFRLPTTYEWLYAYHYSKTLGMNWQSGLDFEAVTGTHFEFAIDSVLDIPLPIAEPILPALVKSSFVMGIPYPIPSNRDLWIMTASPIYPGGGDDGIDEVTHLRLVRIPVN